MLAYDEGNVDARAGPDILRRVLPISMAPQENANLQPYTQADVFCGGGGVSHGAVQPGLKPAWGVDKNRDAMLVYTASFAAKGTEHLLMNVKKFLRRAETRILDFDIAVDVLHASPPSHIYVSRSPKGVSPKDSEVLGSVARFLQLATPRIFNLEEVWEFERTPLFDRLLCGILSQGYSVRWKLANCCDFGVPQKRRRRLILIASA